MAQITINKGGVDIPDGVYTVVLAKLDGPKTIQRADGQDADIFDWTFQVFDGEHEGIELQGTTSTSSGPKSKMFAWLTALFGGKAPAIGTTLNSEDIVGKLALATVRTPEGGWAKIENLGAIPAAMLAGKVAAATGAPVTAPGAPAPVAAPTAAPASDLPF